MGLTFHFQAKFYKALIYLSAHHQSHQCSRNYTSSENLFSIARNPVCDQYDAAVGITYLHRYPNKYAKIRRISSRATKIDHTSRDVEKTYLH